MTDSTQDKAQENRSAATFSLRGMLARGHLRLVIFAVLLAAASITLSGLFLLRGYAATNFALTARTISYTVEPAVLFENRAAIGDAISSVGEVGNIARIVVKDADGKTLGQWQEPRSGMLAQVERATARLIWPGPQTAPVRYNDQTIGTVSVEGSAAVLLRYALSGLVIALCCLGLTVVAMRMLARRLQEDVVSPLENLAEVAHAVRVDRAFSRRVRISGIAEIDQLSRDFNALLAELQGWHSTLVSKNLELAHRAEHDPLTGLGNRERFERTVEDVMVRSSQSGARFALLYVDCDDFKHINDTYGHDVGDMVLCALADRLQQSVRTRDRVFRLGGDEFAILLEGVSDDDAVAVIRQRIEECMAEPFTIALRRERQISVSIGCAIFPDDGGAWRELLRMADRRMYEEKRGRISHAVNDA